MANPQSIEKPVIAAVSVTPDTPMPWSVVVQVLQKNAVKLSKDRKRFQGYVMVDMEGTMIAAVAYEQHIATLNRLLKPYQRYYISNAFVKDARVDCKVGSYPYSWALSTRTPIELIPDAVPQHIPHDFKFIKFSQLYEWIDHDEPIAIRGLIVHSYAIDNGANPNAPRDYIIVDEEKIPVIVRMWADLIDNEYNPVTAKFPQPTMVVLMNAKVTSYHGMSLGSKNNTCVFHNPPLPDGASLLQWYKENSGTVNDMILEEAYKDTNILLPPPSLDEIVPIPEVADLIDAMKVVWVCGTVDLIQAQQSLWYKACQGCNKTIKGNINWEFPCTSCGLKAPGQPRCHVGVYLSGGGSRLPVTLFSLDAEKLIMYTASDLKAADEKNVSLKNEISLSIQNKKVWCFIKCLDRTFQGSNVRTYPALKMYLDSEIKQRETPLAKSVNISGAECSTIVVGSGNAEPTGTPEFFSPTTKNVLEEIHHAASIHTPTVQSTAVKRALAFEPAATTPSAVASSKETTKGTVHDNNLDTFTASCEQATAHAIPSIVVAKPSDDSSSKTQSPIKKIKNKED